MPGWCTALATSLSLLPTAQRYPKPPASVNMLCYMTRELR